MEEALLGRITFALEEIDKISHIDLHGDEDLFRLYDAIVQTNKKLGDLLKAFRDTRKIRHTLLDENEMRPLRRSYRETDREGLLETGQASIIIHQPGSVNPGRGHESRRGHDNGDSEDALAEEHVEGTVGGVEPTLAKADIHHQSSKQQSTIAQALKKPFRSQGLQYTSMES